MGARDRRLGDRSWRRARSGGILTTGLLASLAVPGIAWGQRATLTGYGLGVVVGSAEGPFTDAAAQNATRLRLMGDGGWRALSIDLAYEHSLLLSTGSGSAGLGVLLGTTAQRGDWLPLQGTLDSSEHAVWRHRLDRAAIKVRTGRVGATAGRQTISWATTLFLTPADPFSPFDPADPFRDYRLGVDAARLLVSVGTMGEVDGVVRLAVFGTDTTVTALGRARATIGRTDLAAWGGMLYDQAAFALAATTIALDAALRAEVTLRPEEVDPVLRFAVGADRSFAVGGRTLYAVIEYQYDGFGAPSADSLLAVAVSPAFRRGELQVLGRHEMMVQASYQVHPLAQIGLLGVANLCDASVLLSPSVSWDAGRELTVRAGGYVGLGREHPYDDDGFVPLPLTPGSEYGIVPLTGYVSGAVYF